MKEDAKIIQVKSTTEEERKKADRLVKELRGKIEELIYNYQEEMGVK